MSETHATERPITGVVHESTVGTYHPAPITSYQLRYFDGCFHPFVTRTDVDGRLPSFV